MCNRGQQTLANNTRSMRCNIDFSVPQGSVLGPISFILYVNDLQQALTNVNVQLYADDTVLYLSNSNLSMLVKILQTGPNELSNWCQVNKLTLNPSKTKMMTFGTRHSIKRTKKCQLSLYGLEIKKVSSFQYLGFILDQTLSFRNHVNNIVRKVIHKRTLLSKIMPFLSKNVAVSIYKTMILPYFDYCDEIYQSANKNDLEKLQRLQNKCLKTCISYHMLCETKVVHREAKCACLEDRRKVHITNFMYRRLEKGIQRDERDIPTRRHDAPLFLVPFPHNESFKRSVQYSGAVTWNNLPVNTRI